MFLLCSIPVHRSRGLWKETDRTRLDKQWNNFVESWYPGGQGDPNLLLLRMDLGSASIWSGEAGVLKWRWA